MTCYTISWGWHCTPLFGSGTGGGGEGSMVGTKKYIAPTSFKIDKKSQFTGAISLKKIRKNTDTTSPQNKIASKSFKFAKLSVFDTLNLKIEIFSIEYPHFLDPPRHIPYPSSRHNTSQSTNRKGCTVCVCVCVAGGGVAWVSTPGHFSVQKEQIKNGYIRDYHSKG